MKRAALVALALLAGSCSSGAQYAQAIVALVDVSGTYADQRLNTKQRRHEKKPSASSCLRCFVFNFLMDLFGALYALATGFGFLITFSSTASGILE